LASDPRLLTASGDELRSIIGLRMQAVPYFDQFIVLDAEPVSAGGVSGKRRAGDKPVSR
jgi:hypothetical protein